MEPSASERSNDVAAEASIAPEARRALLDAFRGWKRGAGGGRP